MDQETKKYIKELANELALASHQSKDKEVSGLFKQIDEKLADIINNQNAFDKRSVNWDNTTRIVYGMVSLMLIALIGALIGLVIV